MNLTEPQAGSDVGALSTKATRNDDGTYAITGSKIFITWGDSDFAENVVHLVLARLPDGGKGTKGISLFVVPRNIPDENGEPGVANSLNVVSLEHKMGIHGSPTAVMQYDGATGWLVGEEHDGMKCMFTMMNNARLGVGGQGVGVAEGAYQHALAYALERKQGRTPLGEGTIVDHADVRRMLATMKAETFAARAIALECALAIDMGQASGSKEWKARAAFLTPIAKAFGTDTGVKVADLGIQIHGGMGFVEETGAAQYARDVRILPIYEGTTAIQANDLLGRKVLRDGGETARRFAELIKETETALAQGASALQQIAQGLGRARRAFEDGLAAMLDMAGQDANAAYAASVPFLMLTGTLASGWQLGRAALAAQTALDRGETPAFMAQKIATARFYAQHILVETETERARILAGSASVLDEGHQI